MARQLAAMPTLAGLGEETLALLAREATPRSFAKGETIFQRGATPTGLYFVLTGSVQLLAAEPDGKARTIELFAPGRMFGEIGVFRVPHYRAWTQAVDCTRLVHVPQERVLEAMRSDHELALRILGEVSGRVQSLIEAISQAAPVHASKRVAAYFLEQLGSDNEVTGRIRLAAPKYTIASLLNLTSETFSRVLRKFQDDGLIRGRGRVIEVRDRPRLATLLEV